MTITVKELRQLIADGSDPSQPLRVVAYDVGKKANKHSAPRVDENHPVNLAVSPGLYDERASIEFAYYSDVNVLMPEVMLAQLDDVLEEHPKATVGWVYFFYFPLDYIGLFGRPKKIEACLLDTSKVHDIYFSEDEPNLLVIKAEYSLQSFD